MPPKKAYKIEQIKTQTSVPEAKRVKIIYGPYKLRAANVGICFLRRKLDFDRPYRAQSK